MALNIKDKAGLTPLMRACRLQQTGVVQSLLSHAEVQVDLPDNEGSRAIHHASLRGNAEIIELLLDHGADLDVPDEDGDSPLNIVCWLFPAIEKAGDEHGQGKLAKLGKTLGGMEGLGDLAKDSGPLGRLVSELGKQLGVLENLGQPGNDSEKSAPDGKPVVDKTEAAQACIQLLLERGASVTLACNKGMTPLHNVCFRRSPAATAHALISRGANIDEKNDHSHTSLILAAYTGQVELCRVLIDAGAQVNLTEDKKSTPLWFAAQNGHHTCVEFLLKNGADATLASDKGATPLMIASKDGHTECVRLLLAALTHAPENLDAQIVLGVTALLYASMNGHHEIVEMLVRAGANIEARDPEGDTSLIFACSQGYDECAKVLLDSKANPDAVGKGGGTSVYKACQNGHSKCLALLTQAGADVNIPRDNGTVPLMVSVENNKNECIKLLLEHNAGGLENRDNNGITPLGRSCGVQNNAEMAKILIKGGANVNVRDDDGDTPLVLACTQGYAECAAVLLANKADPDIKCQKDGTATYLACQSGHSACLSLLIKAGADVNIPRDNGARPLQVAVDNNSKECVKLLLLANAEVNNLDRRGLTSLGVACLKGNLDIVEMLIQAGASVDVQDKRGMTPLHLCAMNGHDKCVSALLQAGADQNVQNHVGSTPLNIAVESDKSASVEALLAGGSSSGGNRKTGGGESFCKTNRAKREPTLKAPKKESITITPPMNRGEVASGSSRTGTAHCAHVQDIANAFVKDLNLSNAYFDPNFDVCFCETCHDQRGDNLRYTRGKPPMCYGLPIGWCKFGLRTKPQAQAERIFEEWHVAFHGTRVMNLSKILQTGDLLLPGDHTPGGDELKIPDNHWDPDHKNSKMKPPKGHNVKKFYFSPSIKYSGCDVYAPKWGWRDSSTGQKHTLRVAFQVRIKPGSYDITKETIGARQEMDPLFPNSELEWSTERRGVAILVGLLVKVEGSMKDAHVEDIRQIMGSEVPSTQENFRDDEPGPAVMTSDFRYRTRGGHSINLRAGDAVLRLSTSGTDSVIVHPNVDGDVTVPSSILRPS